MTPECLDDLTAVQFAEGRLTPAARARVIAHLEACAACDVLVGDLLASDSAATPLARPGARPPGTPEVTRPTRPQADGQVHATDLALGAPALPGSPRAAVARRFPPLAGELPRLEGRYRLEGLLARGGMGEIYRATDTELSRVVAIKIPLFASAALLHRFEREVAITARLQHPGVVPVHGAGMLDDGTPFYVMQFVEGTPLDEAVGRAADRDARLALIPHLVSVADTMAYVHGERIVHRDLKPNNVLLGRFGETVVIDWGLAKQLVAPMERPSRDDLGAAALDGSAPRHPGSGDTTRAGDVLGTPAFMAPEQAAGQPVDERADVYALGVMLGFIVADTVPRAGVPIDWTGAARPFESVYLRATSLLPEQRFPTAATFAAALRAALAPEPVVAARPARRRIALAAAAFLLLVPVAMVVRARLRPSSSGAAHARVEFLDITRTDQPSIALSPGGRRLGLAGSDRIEVRDLESGKAWTRPAWIVWPRILTWESDDEIRYSGRQGPDSVAAVHHMSWNLAHDEVTDLGPIDQAPLVWVGELVGGSAVYLAGRPAGPRILRAGGSPGVLAVGTYPVGQVEMSPDHRRFAFVDRLDRVESVIRVADPDGVQLGSPELRDVSAMTWEGPDTLLYATGTSAGATLWRAQVTAAGLAAPTPIYKHVAAEQWIGGIAARGGRVVLSIVSSRFQAHWLDVAAGRDQPLPTPDASAALGWIDATTVLAWNSSSSAIEQRPLERRGLPSLTPVVLHGDPANATRAGSLLVIAQRGDVGRRVLAFDASGAVRWETPPGVLWFVRCAGDVAPPCIAGARTPSGLTELSMIDPASGALGDVVVPEADILDVALDRGGTHLAWVVDGVELRTRTLADRGPGELAPAHVGAVHSLAFVADGTDLVLDAKPDGPGIYRISGATFTRVQATDNAIVSLVRASPDGTRVSYRVRTLSSQLAELHDAP